MDLVWFYRPMEVNYHKINDEKKRDKMNDRQMNVQTIVPSPI